MNRMGRFLILGLMIFSASWDYAHGAVGFGRGESREPKEALMAAREMGVGQIIQAGYIPNAGPANADRSARTVSQPVTWVEIQGTNVNPLPHWSNCGEGEGFCLGTTNGDGDELPIRKVTIKTFEMSKTEVTVEQYRQCVDRGVCKVPYGSDCNIKIEGRELYPMNCVTVREAEKYATFMDARLPTESEWEYAATSLGKKQKYPWGNEDPTCLRAVMNSDFNFVCLPMSHLPTSTLPVLSEDGTECARTKGQTDQGLCDMSGNLAEWVDGHYWKSYDRTPTDGSAYKQVLTENQLEYNRTAAYISRDTITSWVSRGGSYLSGNATHLQADNRDYDFWDDSNENYGFRLAR